MRRVFGSVLLGLAVACGGGGGDGNGTTPPPDASDQVQAALDECGDLLGAMVDLFELFADEVDASTSSSALDVIGTDAMLGQISVTADLDGDMLDELNGAFDVLATTTGEPPAGFDADAFATSLDGLGAALAATSGEVTARFDFLSVPPTGVEISGFIVASLVDGTIEAYDSSLSGIDAGCSVVTLLEQVPGTAFGGAFPDMTLSARIDGPELGFDLVVVFDGTQTATFTATLDGGVELTGSVDLVTGVFTLDP